MTLFNTEKKLWLIAILTLSFLNGCNAMRPMESANDSSPRGGSEEIAPGQYLDYQPIDPFPATFVWIFNPDSTKNELKYWEQLSDSAIITHLPIQSSSVMIRRTDASGSLNYLSGTVSGQAGSYEVIMDYMKYKVDHIYDGSKYLGIGKVGIGLRIVAEVITFKSNINLGSLLSLGAQAQQNNLSGSIIIDVIGIDSKDVTNLLPLTSEIDQSSIQSALQALASIKSRIYEKGVMITPHRVAVKQVVPNSIDNLRQQNAQADPERESGKK